MPFEFTQYQQLYPEAYRNLLTKISISKDSNTNSKCYYSIAQKEGSWFGSSAVNLILTQSLLTTNKIVIYFEKTLQMDTHHRYQPLQQPMNSLQLINVKMIARKDRRLTLAYLTSKQELKQWNFLFTSAELTEEWQQLLRDKKNEALENEKIGKQKNNQIEHLYSQIKVLEGKLQNLRRQYDLLIKEQKRIKQQNKHYRQLVKSLQNQVLLLKSPLKMEINLKGVSTVLKIDSNASKEFYGASFSIFQSIEYLCDKLIVELSDMELSPFLKQLISLIKQKVNKVKELYEGPNEYDLSLLNSILQKQLRPYKSF